MSSVNNKVAQERKGLFLVLLRFLAYNCLNCFSFRGHPAN